MSTEGATVARQRNPQPDWFAADNPDALLERVCPRDTNTLATYEVRVAYSAMVQRGTLPRPAYRRLQFFGCACARMVWELLPTDARNALLIRERFADGRARRADLRAAAVRMVYGSPTFRQQAVNAAGWASAGYWGSRAGPSDDVWDPTEAAREAAKALATRAAGPAPGSSRAKEWHAAWTAAFIAARAHQAELVRDIFPPPGFAPELNRDWLTDTVLALARQADESGEYSALPILADALQDAGCNNEVMLDRCRAPSGIHGRGNWVVDLLLGRE
jgi:hypothetical protein